MSNNNRKETEEVIYGRQNQTTNTPHPSTNGNNASENSTNNPSQSRNGDTASEENITNNPPQSTNRGSASDRNAINNANTHESESAINNGNKDFLKILKWIGIVFGVVVLLAVVVYFCVFKKKKKNIIDENDDSDPIPDIPDEKEDDQVLKPIFKFNNKVGDLKRITVNQTSYETMTTDGQVSKFLVHRNTTYDIYIKSEQNPEEKSKNFYSKKYIAVMNIVKECFSTKGESCEPKSYMDLSSTQNKNNLRNLEEINDLKDFPVPICFIEFTDNDAITSITCPESLSENKKYEMTLDFYFFRPPAIERPGNNFGLFSNDIEEIPIDNGKITRERNWGICDTKNAFNTYCTTDMNTTTDLNNNVMSYDEIAFSNFSTDENNSYVKTKKTFLKDITNQSENFNKNIYEKKLKDFTEKLEPYLKKDVLFSESEFKELHSIIKENKTEEETSNKRNLDENFEGLNPYIKEGSLFFKEINGVQINLKLRNDIGVGKDSMETNSLLTFDDIETDQTNQTNQTNLTDILASKTQQSPINNLLEKLIILSKAGNNLANELYDQIKEKLASITKDISLIMSSINDMIVYNDLVSIFDSSLSVEKIDKLPTAIIKESQNLYDSLDNKLIDITEIINYKNILNKDVYHFLSESHDLINKLHEKLKEFSDKIGSPKGQLAEIATYYLNNTSDSYITIISNVENILKNYYINEKESILNEVNEMLTSFEKNVKNSVEKELGIIKNIKIQLENGNMTINLASENNTKKVISNLDNSTNLISNIISDYKNKIKSGLGLKDNGYFINENDVQSLQSNFNYTIKKGYENAQNIDNDDLIDKIYDEIMSNFRENFTKIKNYMNNKRDETFFMDEEVLKNNKFTNNEKDEFSNGLESLCIGAVNEIINENNENINTINSKIKNFISTKKEKLNQLINDIDKLFSEENLEKLFNTYKNTFENSLELIKKQINGNEQLSSQYLDYLYRVLSNDTEIAPYLYYKLGQVLQDIPKHRITVTEINNYVRKKYYTKAYLIKYDYYSSSFDSSKDYINNQMYIDLSYEYKNLIIKLKTLLQSVKNNIFSDKYGDLTELSFVDDNIRIIDNLYTRLDRYFSESLFNDNYLVKFNTFKQNEIQVIQKIKQTLDEKNKLIINNYSKSNDKTRDFCATYNQAGKWTCENGVVRNIQAGGTYYYNLMYYSGNHNELVTTSIKSENNLEKLQTEFENFFSSINQNISEYNNILITLKNEITSLETDGLNKAGQLTSLDNINENIKTFLNEKYGNNLIKDSYDFHQKNTENKLTNLLNFTSEKWIESFEILDSEVKKNIDKFKNNAGELSSMGYIYIARLNYTINDFSNSIINQQKIEFNYTISYYYNYLYSLVNKTYKYIIGKIPTNRDGFNNILNYRKNQIIEKYNEIIQIIKNSENNALNEKNQINCLIVPITNFFKVNNIVVNSLNQLQTKLGVIILSIGSELLSVSKDPTQNSISANLYLENSENGKIVQELTNSINSVDFINLNQDKFKDLMDNNIIFDQENLISNANSLISKSNLETLTEYQTIREDYTERLENEIKKFFTKESLIVKINSLYKKGINELDDISRNKTLLNVNEILEIVVKYIKEESERLNNTLTTYNSNYETINKTIKNYKEEIFNKVKNEMTILFETLNKNMYDKIYTNYLEEGLNEYVTNIKAVTSSKEYFKEYKTLGNSYKLGEYIDEIAEKLSSEYKNIGEHQIKNIIKENYYKPLNLEDIEQLINEKIDSAFNSYLFPALKIYAIYDVNSFSPYDFSGDIKNNINSTINENLQKIKDIMNATKGENYDLILDYNGDWILLDFSKIGILMGEIGNEFNTYMTNEINEEKKKFNSNFKNIINTNFNEMLNNFIPSFGDKFFERISEYNLNNRIDNLFNNYKYSFSQTFFFYLLVLTGTEFNILKDLKQKLFKVNDVDLVIEQNKDIILEIVNNKIEEFIKDTSDYLVSKYVNYMKTKENNLEFSKLYNETIELIQINLEHSKDEIINNYNNSLQIYLKSPLIKKYELYLNEKISELVKSINDQRQSVSSQLKDVPIVDSEEILNEINEKIDSVSEQIDNYKIHFNQYNISEKVKQFLFSYGDNSLKPLFDDVINLINNATKFIILQNLNENSNNYEKKLDINSFNNKITESQSFLNKTYINFINNKINLYDSKNYANKLENEKDKVKSRRRRYLENLNSENDNKEDYSDRVADKPLDDTFSKLLNTADSVVSFVDSLNEFNKYDELIKKYNNSINIAAKNSSRLINMYDFEEDIMNNLNNKLSYLKNISLNYYNKVNDNYFIIRNNIKNSIKKINDELKKCANATYEAFGNNYNNILNNEITSMNKTYSSNDEEKKTIKHESIMQNGKNIFEAEIQNFRRYSEFKFDIQYEESKNIRKPKISASVTNRNSPKKMKFKIYSPFGTCGKRGKKIEIEFNDANYSTNLNFDTKSTDIKLTTNTKFEKYSYITIPFEVEDSNEVKCVTILGDKVCKNAPCINEKEDLPEKNTKVVDAKEFSDNDIL